MHGLLASEHIAYSIQQYNKKAVARGSRPILLGMKVSSRASSTHRRSFHDDLLGANKNHRYTARVEGS